MQQKTAAMRDGQGPSGARTSSRTRPIGSRARERDIAPSASAPEREKPLFGRLLGGKYRIQSFLGGGGMGAVYRARQVGLDRTVAVKIMHPSLAQNPDFAARFHREAQAASLLAHPASIAIIDFGEEPDGLLYLVMEFVDGRTLEQVIEDAAPLPPERIAGILDQVLAALAVAHDQGIVHRDLKPENVLVYRRSDADDAGDEIAKVCDFGIASLRQNGSPSVLPPEPSRRAVNTCKTQVGTILGSPAYMAPEQAAGESTDARSDVYAIGIVLYEMLTGRHPFAGVSDMLEAQQTSVPPHARAENPGCDAALAEIALRAMQKDPTARFPSARAMRAAIRRAREREATPPSAPAAKAHDPNKTVLGIGAASGHTNQKTLRMEWLALPPASEEPAQDLAKADLASSPRLHTTALTARRRATARALLDWRSVMQGVVAFTALTTVGLFLLFLAYD